MIHALNGLLLVGGKSSRMGSNKAQLTYRDGLPEWQRLHAILEELCDEVYLSHPAGIDYGVPAINDPGQGPLAAIHSAFEHDANADWLVIACDLPLLERTNLEQLLKGSDATYDASAFSSRVDGKHEPLCTLYRQSAGPAIATAIDQGDACPRHILHHKIKTQSMQPDQPHALDNANSPADALEVRAHLSGARVEKSIQVRYFAQLKEIANKDAEEWKTSSVTPSGIYEELKAKYQFPHKQKQLMVAINDDFADWATPVKEGDELVFIPPVAGG
ncbi:NTP transferase domain-containing protein [Rubritalea marina]|uniref:NTP transferase domain-containing protein n=1 Tax=Rubritalea marina TaxID=361055 RepID=UPI0003814639|nr:NTP transferase domain-containing protein [Rubritalea marina]